MVLFGGLGSAGGMHGGRLNDTWEFHAGNWTQVTPPASPLPRYTAAMAYDAANHDVLLVGGNSSLGPADDSWTFGGAAWTHLNVSGPTPRYGAAMTFDYSAGWLQLQGGIGLHSTDSPPLNWTWSFKGGAWYHSISTRYWAEPRHRFGGGFASSLNTTLLVGGAESPNAWGGDGAPFYVGAAGPYWVRWISQLQTAHSGPRSGLADQFPGFVWDASDGYFLYLFSGLTWITRN